jgi:hypothetical protein
MIISIINNYLHVVGGSHGGYGGLRGPSPLNEKLENTNRVFTFLFSKIFFLNPPYPPYPPYPP